MTDERLRSLDQFRGYTVAGMFLVNYIGGFHVVAPVLKHHNTYCSYADTIMPQFFFAVGFALRLTFLRRKERDGTHKAVSHAIWRDLGLILLGVVWYHLDGKVQTWTELQGLGLQGVMTRAFLKSPFQTLTSIGVTSLWVLPVIGASASVRVGYLIISSILHLVLSHAFYFDWSWHHVIDGGPLGFLTWSIPVLVGSLTFDVMNSQKSDWFARLILGSLGLMTLGIVLSRIGGEFSWPFVETTKPPNLWTMSQRTGSVTYLTFSTGFSLLVYLLFVFACDRGRMDVGMFGLLGRNALAAYLVHSVVAEAMKPYTPKDSPAWYVVASFGLYFAISCLFVQHLEKRGARV